MPDYTTSLLDLLQFNEDGTETSINPIDPDYISNLSDRVGLTVFPSTIHMISEEYRQVFAAGFGSTFMFHELGFDTVTSFRHHVAGVLAKNAGYINRIFEVDAREIFSSYTVTKGNSETLTDRSDTDTSSTNTDRTSETSSDSSTKTSGSSDTDTQSTTNGDHNNTGSSSTTNSGTDSTKRSGSDTVDSSNNSSTTHGLKVSNSGAITDTYNNYKVSGNSTEETSGPSITTGSEWSNGSEQQVTKNYRGVDVGGGTMSDSAMSGASQVETSSPRNQSESKTTSPTTTTSNTQTTSGSVAHGNNTATTNSGTDSVRGSDESMTTYNTTDSTSHGLKVSGSTTDEGTSNSTTTSNTGNTSEGTSDTGSTSNSIDDSRSTTERTGSGNSKSTGKNDSESFQVSYDMVIRMQPVLNRVWGLFDSAFMQVI